SRRPSRTRPDGPWLADVERTGELGKNHKETRANKGAGQASPPQAGSVSTHQTPATPKVTVQHSARVKNCLVQVFAGKDESPLTLCHRFADHGTITLLRSLRPCWARFLKAQIARDYFGCTAHHLLHAVLVGKAGTGILLVGDFCERQ